MPPGTRTPAREAGAELLCLQASVCQLQLQSLEQLEVQLL
jgi:hypothetical protein